MGVVTRWQAILFGQINVNVSLHMALCKPTVEKWNLCTTRALKKERRKERKKEFKPRLDAESHSVTLCKKSKASIILIPEAYLILTVHNLKMMGFAHCWGHQLCSCAHYCTNLKSLDVVRFNCTLPELPPIAEYVNIGERLPAFQWTSPLPPCFQSVL